MGLLDSVTAVVGEIGLPAPDSLIAATVASAVPANNQMLQIANTTIRRLVDGYPWSAQITDYPFVFTNNTEFYPFPDDFGKPINQTGWDSSLRRPLNGPVNPQDWQFFKQYGVSGGVWPRYRIKGNRIQVDPIPVTGSLDTATMSYFSKWGVVLGTPIGDVTNSRLFTDDADGFFCDDSLFELTFKWRLLRAKGLDYAEEMADAELALMEWQNSDGSKAVIDQGDPTVTEALPNTIPGIITGPFP